MVYMLKREKSKLDENKEIVPPVGIDAGALVRQEEGGVLGVE